jgi:predicted nucleotidyltransferase
MRVQRWKELLDERLHEAVTVLGTVPGIRGFLVGGSVGRGEAWPMSDIDLLPVFSSAHPDLATLVHRRDGLAHWWAGSGRAQSLDVGGLAFTAAEIREATAAGPSWVIAKFGERRWFHGLDKAYGGHAADPADHLVAGFTAWITETRFHPDVVAARIEVWRQHAKRCLAEAVEAQEAHPGRATDLMRESARALRMVLLEEWGERMGSMGREWTRFERMARRHGHPQVAARIAEIAGADAPGAAERARHAPAWLAERIDLCLAARQLVGEEVTAAENARDQLAAFTVIVGNHEPHLIGPWIESPDPRLDAHLAELAELIGS